jgi:DNA-binding MurR/RpiR family transcriptional regulator
MNARDRDPLLSRIEAASAQMTRSERLIAAYITAHASQLAVESAASVARIVKVSPMTVGRFLRTLGYASFDELRREISRAHASSSWHVGDRYAQFTRARGSITATMASSLDQEINALMAVYGLAAGPAWTALVKRIATSHEVYVAGFQTVRGVAMDFAARLEYLRDGVCFMDGTNGTYAELFARPSGTKRCLILVDIRRYARQAQLLAEAASQAAIPITIVTDAHCHWARSYTADVFHVPTEVGLFWDSNAAITSLLNLLINGVIGRLGDRVDERARRLESLQARFGAFLD